MALVVVPLRNPDAALPNSLSTNPVSLHAQPAPDLKPVVLPAANGQNRTRSSTPPLGMNTPLYASPVNAASMHQQPNTSQVPRQLRPTVSRKTTIAPLSALPGPC